MHNPSDLGSIRVQSRMQSQQNRCRWFCCSRKKPFWFGNAKCTCILNRRQRLGSNESVPPPNPAETSNALGIASFLESITVY